MNIAKALAALALASGLALGLAPHAEATRPTQAATKAKKDYCTNIPGKQTVLDIIGPPGDYRPNVKTKKPNDCVPVKKVRKIRHRH